MIECALTLQVQYTKRTGNRCTCVAPRCHGRKMRADDVNLPIAHVSGWESRALHGFFLRKVSASRWDLTCTGTRICSAMGRVRNEAWRTSSDVSSWRNVSLFAESLISRWSQPRQLGYALCQNEVTMFETEFNWQISKCDCLVYNLCADIRWWWNRFGCSCKQGLTSGWDLA